MSGALIKYPYGYNTNSTTFNPNVWSLEPWKRSEPIDANYQRILSMERGLDWDGEGALPITAATCSAAVHFAQLIDERSLRPPDWLAPSTAGAIGFTWRTRNDQLNVQLSSRASTGCIVRRSGSGGSRERECSIPRAIEELSSFLALD